MGTNRRDVIKTLAALPLMRLSGADPDVVLHNGLVYTVNPAAPEATAVAIECEATGARDPHAAVQRVGAPAVGHRVARR